MRKNLKGLPELNKLMKRGECRSEIVDGVQCLVWKDRKVVPIINTISDPSNVSQVMRQNKDGTRSPVSCPDSVRLYNNYMGGVDLFNARRKTYSCSRKSRKWWLRLFYFLLDASVTNAYILYKETPGTKQLTLKEFVLQLCERLIAMLACHFRKAYRDIVNHYK